MRNERRSAFSRAVRSTVGNVAFGPISARTEFVPPVKAPDATVSHYALQLALAELERARATVAELREGLRKIAYEPFGQTDASHAEVLQKIENLARALLAKLDAEGQS